MYNTLIDICNKLEKDDIIKKCKKIIHKAHDKAYTLDWNGKSKQAEKLIADTKNALMYEYPIYMQYYSCLLLIKQYDYACFDSLYKRELSSFISRMQYAV